MIDRINLIIAIAASERANYTMNKIQMSFSGRKVMEKRLVLALVICSVAISCMQTRSALAAGPSADPAAKGAAGTVELEGVGQTLATENCVSKLRDQVVRLEADKTKREELDNRVQEYCIRRSDPGGFQADAGDSCRKDPSQRPKCDCTIYPRLPHCQ